MASDTTLAAQIVGAPGFADILRDDLAASPDPKSDERTLDSQFQTLMIQSGLEFPPSVMLGLVLVFGFGLAGAEFVLRENPLTTLIALTVGSTLPIGFAMFQRSQRRKAILEQLPEMIDAMARSARAGRNIEQCLELVAHDTPEPLHKELLRCSHRVSLGIPITEALEDLPYRTGIDSLRLFDMTLGLSRDLGGDPVIVLDRLAETIRQRILFLTRMRAGTASSRATAILMLLVPLVVIVFFVWRDPEYLQNLMRTTWGRGSLIAAGMLQLIGGLWILRILNTTSNS